MSKILRKAKIPLPVLAILVAYPLATYNPQLHSCLSLLGAAAILLLARVAWPSEWRARTGFAIPRGALLPALLLALACAGIACAIIARAAERSGIDFLPTWSLDEFAARTTQNIGQSLNEEIVLGALLLEALRRRFGRCRLLSISLAVALLFAFFHYAFYAFRPEGFVNHGVLSPPALAAIFAVGVLRNNLILAYRHIAFSWAIHLGWNIVFLGSVFAYASGGDFLSEPQRFDAFLGCWPSVVVAATAAVASTYLLRARLLVTNRDENHA